jgi:hypothetical protein
LKQKVINFGYSKETPSVAGLIVFLYFNVILTGPYLKLLQFNEIKEYKLIFKTVFI